jgi:hypothetical protein
MTKTDHLLHPTHCFCQIPESELRPWAIKRYKERHSTLELICSTDDPHEKEIISIVAMLDVDDETLLELMGDVDLPEHHILHCRESVKRMLEIHD